MRTRITTALTLALLTLTACGNDAEAPNVNDQTTSTSELTETTTSPTEEPTSEEPTSEEPEEGDVPPMDGDTAPMPDGTFPPNQIPLGEPAYQAVMYQGHNAPLEWEATLTDFHCDVDIDLLNKDFEQELLAPYIPRDGHVLCAANITYENIGTVPGTVPREPAGLISNGAIYEQTTDYSLFVINDIIMSGKLGGPFNPGITFDAQTLIEAPEGLDVDAVYLEPDDTEVATYLLVE